MMAHRDNDFGRLTGAGGAVFQVGTTTDATSDHWSPSDFGTFAFYNDDTVSEAGGAAQIVLYSASIDLSGYLQRL